MTEVPPWIIGVSTTVGAVVIIVAGSWRARGARATIRLILAGVAVAGTIVLVALLAERIGFDGR